MTLTLHKLEGWYFEASVDGGPVFELGYMDVDDWCDENAIDKVKNESGVEIQI